MFNQRFNLPDGLALDNLVSDVYAGGRLVISAPQLEAMKAEGPEDESREVSKSGEKVTTVSEGEIALEGGGKAKTTKQETSEKKSKVETIKKAL